MEYQVTELNLMTLTTRYTIIMILLVSASTTSKGLTRARMPYLLFTVVDLSKIKGLVHVGYLSNDDGTLYFTQIDNRDEKLRHLHHIHPLLAASQGGPKS